MISWHIASVFNIQFENVVPGRDFELPRENLKLPGGVLASQRATFGGSTYAIDDFKTLSKIFEMIYAPKLFLEYRGMF